MPDGALRRRLGLGQAVVIGVGSMVGAGVFTVWSPAAAAAGTALLVGLGIAAVVALCNATSSARLAAVHPESGGAYVYGRRQLGPVWGFLAGWGFVVGKTASCAAIALTVGAYLWPSAERIVAVAAVAGVTIVNLGGLTRTAAVTRLILAVTLAVLAVVVIAGWAGDADVGRLAPLDAGPFDVLRSAGFLFFAFAGYARIATLGEEVRDPAWTIPRAIVRALAFVLVVYTIVAVTTLAVVPVDDLAATQAPLQLVVERGPWPALEPVVRVGAALAALGVLFNLLPGVSRTMLAMARRTELPAWLAAVDEQRATPVRAELTVALVVMIAVIAVDLRDAIGFSSVTVLTYYAVANASAMTLRNRQRRAGMLAAIVGLVGCVTLAVTLPWEVLAVGAGVLLVGVLGRTIARGLASSR